MNPSLSIWLELSRVIAALVVFVGHSTGIGVAPVGVHIQWHRTADDAVMAFFVISGMVIAYSTEVSHRTARQYVLARTSRIYSVALTTVLFALLIDHVGMRVNVNEYTPDWQYPKLWFYLPLHWLFLGETWFGAIYPFTMAPYWSLGYEVWYYVLFGCLTFLRGRTRWAAVAAVLLIMGPRIWLLLPTWWLGVWLYRRLHLLKVSRAVGLGLMALSMAAYGAYLASGLRDFMDQTSLDFYDWLGTVLHRPFFKGSTVHVLSDYVTALIFAVFLVGAANSGVVFGTRASAWIRQAASYTFTFYMIHYTLLVFALALGLRQVDWGTYASVLTAVLLSTWALAQIGEQRRHGYRAAFAWAWDALSRLPRR